MGFVPNSLGLGYGQNALIDLRRELRRCGRNDRGVGDGWTSSCRWAIPRDQILAAPIVPGRSRDWGRVIGRKPDVALIKRSLAERLKLLERAMHLPFP